MFLEHVAQLVEWQTAKMKVVGSIPTLTGLFLWEVLFTSISSKKQAMTSCCCINETLLKQIPPAKTNKNKKAFTYVSKKKNLFY